MEGDAEPTPAGGGEPIEETAAAAEQQEVEVDEPEPADEAEPADRGEGDAELYASSGDGALLEPPTDEQTAEDGADMGSAGGADGGADEVGDEKDAPADEGAEDGYIDDADGEATLEEKRGAAYDGAEGEGVDGFADDGLGEEEEEDRGVLDEEDEEEDEDGRGGVYDEGEGSDLDDAEADAGGDSANGSARGAGGGEEDGEEGRAAPSAAADDEVLDEEEEDEEEAGGLYGDEDEDAYNDFDMGLDGADALAEEQQLSEQELSAQLAERIESARDEHSARLQANQMLQRKLAEHLRAAKGSEERPQDDATDRASVHEQEARYVKALAQLQTLKGALAQVQERFDAHAAELNTKLTHKEAKAREITQAFAEFKREIMSAAENSRTGRPIAPKLVRMFEDGEKERDEELAQMRLAHISRRTQKEKLEYALRQKEKLADGLHLIDFEQLKIENQTLNEKIEERNEELLKLRKKMSTSAHVLTHFKEKLQFVAAENAGLKNTLAEREVQLVGRRDQLTSIKQARDALRMDNAGMKSTRPLVSSEELLLDFERRKQKLQQRKVALDALQARYGDITSQMRQQRSATNAAIR